MGRKPGMIYVPLDVEFFDNDKVLEAGEKAGWLFLAMTARAKKLLTDGVLTESQIARLHVTGWKARLKALVAEGLVEDQGEGRWLIVGFLERNMSAAEVEQKRAADRARKASTTPPDSDPPPRGIRRDSARNPSGPLREVKRREDRGRGDVDETTHQGRPAVVGHAS